MNLTFLIVGISFLLVLSILDFFTFNKKQGFIPSVLTTMFLIVAFILGTVSNSGVIITTIILGILLSLLFTDLDLWGGIADLKIFIGCCMLFNSVLAVFFFAFFCSLLGFLVKVLVVKNSKLKSIPYIPILLIAFLASAFLF